ncbi:Calcium-transporting ATPase 3 endoplasmic reticulum-type [Bienertia sinuspersici]
MQVGEAVVTGWLFFRYVVIGAYVGLATVAGFIWWFVYAETGPRLPYSELMNFDTCHMRQTSYPCSIFEDRHPSTVSMTVLVVVEMFNALNNLSENQSLAAIPPWSNLWLVGSIILTLLLHILILYIQPLSILFSVTPLSWTEWKVVLYLSFPVIMIDEVLKFLSRNSRGFLGWVGKVLRKVDFGGGLASFRTFGGVGWSNDGACVEW